MTSGEGIEMDKNEAHSESENRLLRLEQEVADLRERLARLEVPSESEVALEPSTEPVVQQGPQSIDRVAITEEPPPTIAPDANGTKIRGVQDVFQRNRPGYWKRRHSAVATSSF